MIKIITYILTFLITYLGVKFVRHWSLKKEFLDIPNERSSHKVPTPTGGGIPIVFVSLCSFLLYQYVFMTDFIWSYILGAILIALISWIDDLVSISALWRFICHFIAAFVVIYQLGYWEVMYIPYIGEIRLEMFGVILTSLWIVWVINAYNFMDGIDGLAGIQAITASIGWAFVGWFWGIDIFLFVGLTLFLSNTAFLLHNWHPAKIFMGDVGSAFLGYTFAVFPMLGVFETGYLKIQTYLPVIAILFLWLFVFDTIVTFLKRLKNKEKVWKAHRQHIYQLLVIKSKSHSLVAGYYGLLSLIVTVGVLYCIVVEKFELLLISLVIMVTSILILTLQLQKKLTK